MLFCKSFITGPPTQLQKEGRRPDERQQREEGEWIHHERAALDLLFPAVATVGAAEGRVGRGPAVVVIMIVPPRQLSLNAISTTAVPPIVSRLLPISGVVATVVVVGGAPVLHPCGERSTPFPRVGATERTLTNEIRKTHVFVICLAAATSPIFHFPD